MKEEQGEGHYGTERLSHREIMKELRGESMLQQYPLSDGFLKVGKVSESNNIIVNMSREKVSSNSLT